MKRTSLILLILGMGKIALTQTYLPLTAGSGSPLTGTLYGTGFNLTGSTDMAILGSASRKLYFAPDGNGVSMLTGAAQTGNGIYLNAADNTTNLYTSSNNRYSIDASGNHDFKSGTATFGGATTISTPNPTPLVLNSTTGGYNLIQHNYAGTAKAFSGYNSGSAFYGGEAGVGVIIQANGQIAQAINTSLATTFYGSLLGTSATFTGNVGIGTTTPSEKLSVNGKIRAKEIKVETANWPDYVFSKDYSLPDLKDIEQHISEKGHLPEIPSAKEVEEEGISLGEMNAKLLKKIEELTLHLIEQSKRLDAQQKEINRLKSKF